MDSQVTATSPVRTASRESHFEGILMTRFQVGTRYMLSEQTVMLMRLWLGLCLVGIIAFFQVDVSGSLGKRFSPISTSGLSLDNAHTMER